ncbi:hypothetical protein M409DRAFT_24113 [Zasmidium cellare ATCC 36951]|uniref:Uncharacterized protein n=1 Tax=Zasmidium cellare ATCC 36951 TaxID=1080233 RepID=A0A6A6CK68_ZASCE|nr:uncharacterized protein M409DRAFT_24113 [Zasmidium cellare ATCC 36951]KAF2165826.1 hypothetical protein M409DRAFT_24113 [Zasmidium cellare ATCC 36951]
MTAQLTAEIKRFRASASNPPPSTGCMKHYDGLAHDHDTGQYSLSTAPKDGLDFERSSALHNAIVRHGWVARGHHLSELPQRTYWERWAPTLTPYQLESLRERLHPSVLAFLQQALELPDFYPGTFQPPVFFYHLVGLSAPLELFANHEETEGDRYVTLYSLQDAVATEGRLAGGVVYDQVRHECALIKDVDDTPALSFEERQLSWKPLETILTEYCDMIEADKVVALPKSVKGPEPFEYVRSPAGGYAMKAIPEQELRDPRTGARRTEKTSDPWVMVPFTSKDVEMAVVAWDRLIEVIEARMPKQSFVKKCCRESVYSVKTPGRAGLRRDSFAFSFLSRAAKPGFSKIAPGLRLLTAEEFVHQPFQDVTLGQACSTPPILLLKNDDLPDEERRLEVRDEVPAGLCLGDCDADKAFPYENVVRMVGPIQGLLGRPDEKPDELHELPRANELHKILERFSDLVESGQWIVGPDGVESRAMHIDDS